MPIRPTLVFLVAIVAVPFAPPAQDLPPQTAVGAGTFPLLPSVYFDVNSSALRAEADSQLVMALRWMKANPHLRLRVEGNADERGTDDYNLELSRLRVMSVLQWFQIRGISPERFERFAHGAERPLCNEPDDSCWRTNRRVDFRISSHGTDKPFVIPPPK